MGLTEAQLLKVDSLYSISEEAKTAALEHINNCFTFHSFLHLCTFSHLWESVHIHLVLVSLETHIRMEMMGGLYSVRYIELEEKTQGDSGFVPDPLIVESFLRSLSLSHSQAVNPASHFLPVSLQHTALWRADLAIVSMVCKETCQGRAWECDGQIMCPPLHHPFLSNRKGIVHPDSSSKWDNKLLLILIL